MKIVLRLKLQIAFIKCYVALNTCRMYSLLYNHMGAKLEFHKTFKRICRTHCGSLLEYIVHIGLMQKNIIFQRMQIELTIIFRWKLQIAFIRCYVAVNTCRMCSLLYNHMRRNLNTSDNLKQLLYNYAYIVISTWVSLYQNISISILV